MNIPKYKLWRQSDKRGEKSFEIFMRANNVNAMEVSKKDTVEIGSKTLVLWTKINLHINKILNTFVNTDGNGSLSKCTSNFVSRHTLLLKRKECLLSKLL